METINRITREQMYIEFLNTTAKRSTCPRKQVGSILVRDKRIIAMGYNGTLPGVSPLYGIDPETGESRTVHAEANLISFCAKEGIATAGCELWVSLSPCEKCAELIFQAGIRKVFYIEEYRDTTGIGILREQGLEVCQVNIK